MIASHRLGYNVFDRSQDIPGRLVALLLRALVRLCDIKIVRCKLMVYIFGENLFPRFLPNLLCKQCFSISRASALLNPQYPVSAKPFS